MVSNFDSAGKYTRIDITFDQAVTVTESYFSNISWTKLFSDFGGSLGLWLGIGSLQIFMYAVNLGKGSKK